MKKRTRVDFREMPDYTKPERYAERKYMRDTAQPFNGDIIDDPDAWAWESDPLGPFDHGDR